MPRTSGQSDEADERHRWDTATWINYRWLTLKVAGGVGEFRRKTVRQGLIVHGVEDVLDTGHSNAVCQDSQSFEPPGSMILLGRGIGLKLFCALLAEYNIRCHRFARLMTETLADTQIGGDASGREVSILRRGL